MEIIYITHHSILNLHAVPPGLTWALAIGAGYGAVQLVKDALRVIFSIRMAPSSHYRQPEEPPK